MATSMPPNPGDTAPPEFIAVMEANAQRDAATFWMLVNESILYYTRLHKQTNYKLPMGPDGPSLNMAIERDRQKFRRKQPRIIPEMAVAEEEWHLAALTITYALLNPVKLNIDGERLAHRTRKIIHPQDDVVLQEPCVLVDLGGRILAWVLPGIFAPWRERSYYNAHRVFSGVSIPGKGKGWRYSQANLRHPAHELCTSGAMDFSVGWQSAGHQGPDFELYFSKSLLKTESLPWLDNIHNGERIVNAVMGVIHPQFFQSMLEGMKKTSQLPGWEKHRWIHEHWPTVFSGISTITNRISPAHRDDQAPQHGYDMLSSHGEYSHGRLRFPDLNVTVAYNPGGLYGFSGSLLKHECTEWNRRDGDRICYARWIRDPVHEVLRVPRCPWSLYAGYEILFDASYPASRAHPSV